MFFHQWSSNWLWPMEVTSLRLDGWRRKWSGVWFFPFGTKSMTLYDYSSCQVTVFSSLGLWLRGCDTFPLLLFPVCLTIPCERSSHHPLWEVLSPSLPTLLKAVPSLSLFIWTIFIWIQFSTKSLTDTTFIDSHEIYIGIEYMNSSFFLFFLMATFMVDFYSLLYMFYIFTFLF